MKNLPFIILLALAFSASAQYNNSFGVNGKLKVLADSNYWGFSDFNITPQGKLLVYAGAPIQLNSLSNYGKNIFLRLNKDGYPDTSFATDGTVIDLDGLIGKKVKFEASGRMVTAGYYYVDSSPHFATTVFSVKRYLPNGTPDSSFGNHGKTMTLDSHFSSMVSDLLIQPDGKILVAGSTAIYNWITFTYEYGFSLIRYNSNGKLDSSFGLNGISDLHFAGDEFCEAIALQSDGKIIVAGDNSLPGGHLALLRLKPNGKLDSTFADNGHKFFDIGNFAVACAVQIVNGNKILIAGSSLTNAYAYTLARFNVNGSFDSTFGTNGVAVAPQYGSGNVASCMDVQSDGKIVLGGIFCIPNTTSNTPLNGFGLMRFSANGFVDSTFADNGKLYCPIDTIGSEGFAVKIGSDNNIYLAGSVSCYYSGVGIISIHSGVEGGSPLTIINQNTSSLALSVYPNPVTDRVKLSFHLDAQQSISIDLRDVRGNLLKTIIANKEYIIGSHIEEVNIPSYLPDGVYAIVLTTSSGKATMMIRK